MDKFITKLQNLTQTSKSELFVLFLIIFGLAIGLSVEYFQIEESNLNAKDNTFAFLDSVALAEQTTYIATDNHNNSFDNLATADTVVEKKNLFPQHNTKKKEIISGKININKASKVQLMKLPGIGEKTADKIILYREQQTFQKIEDIMNIKGIGNAKFAKMKEFIEVQ